MDKLRYADIIVDINIEKLDKTYQYSIPWELSERVHMGSVVMIPFGKGKRLIKGYVVGVSDRPKIPEDKIKPIAFMPEQSVSATEILLKLAGWIKERYGGTMSEAIKTVLPVKKSVRAVTKKYVYLAIDVERAKAFLAELKTKKNAAARVRLLSVLIDCEYMEYSAVSSVLNVSKTTIDSLAKQGIVCTKSERIYRNPLTDSLKTGHAGSRDRVTLNVGQRAAVDEILSIYRKKSGGSILLHGVTGSGKTEVYIAAADEVIKSGKQVIMLIPEISLTYQTMERFYSRFGSRVSVLNSRMSLGEKYDQYERAKNGEIDIIIGPRSALFIPFDRLGMIIIDEEHESSYKSEMPPKYHAREVAETLAGFHGAVLLMGSATPSIDTYYKTTPDYKGDNKVKLIELNERCGSAQLPEVSVVDMGMELKEKNYSMISKSLHGKIKDCLSRHEQIMLFINRRGYSGFISCRNCGESIKCPHCDVSLSFHHLPQGDKMMCHYCGYETEPVRTCPKCGSKYIGGFGTGTQKVEELVQKEFPGIRTLRMDSDTTSGKEGHRPILEAFNNYKADILIGTQMIVKGHDFPMVTLVGILAADMTLHLSDYSSAQKTYELLVQAAGRAGRGKLPGQVVIQTYMPRHYAIVCATEQNYKSFYEQEISFRRLMKYPPTAYFMTVFVSSGSMDLSQSLINFAADICRRIIGGRDIASIIGPAPHQIVKVNDMYRYQLHVKSGDMAFLCMIRETIEKAAAERFAGSRYGIQFDVR